MSTLMRLPLSAARASATALLALEMSTHDGGTAPLRPGFMAVPGCTASLRPRFMAAASPAHLATPRGVPQHGADIYCKSRRLCASYNANTILAMLFACYLCTSHEYLVNIG